MSILNHTGIPLTQDYIEQLRMMIKKATLITTVTVLILCLIPDTKSKVKFKKKTELMVFSICAKI